MKTQNKIVAALEHLHRAQKLLIDAGLAAKLERNYPLVESCVAYADKVREIVSSDNGQCGVEALLEESALGMDDYEGRVRAYEAEGMTRSDAQGVVEAEDLKS